VVRLRAGSLISYLPSQANRRGEAICHVVIALFNSLSTRTAQVDRDL
jgi:hypothetical protein